MEWFRFNWNEVVYQSCLNPDMNHNPDCSCYDGVGVVDGGWNAADVDQNAADVDADGIAFREESVDIAVDIDVGVDADVAYPAPQAC